MTSNLGSSYLLEGVQPDGTIAPEALQAVDALLKTSFRPEFLNRLDEIVTYKPLTRAEIFSIVDLQIASLNKRLADKELSVSLTNAAKNMIIDESFDPAYGARPLKRYIQRKIDTMIARSIIKDEVAPGDKLVIDVEGGELMIRR